MWRTHEADLQVTVRGAHGTIMQETVIQADDDVIDPQAESGFFLQLAVEVGHEAQVTVKSHANRINRWGYLSEALSQTRLFKNWDGFLG